MKNFRYSMRVRRTSLVVAAILPALFASPVFAQTTVTNPLGPNASFCLLIQGILDAAMVIGAPIAVLFVVLAGLKFILAMGNPTSLQNARSNLLHTLIGIGIFFGAWVIAQVLFSTLQQFNIPNITVCSTTSS